MTSKEDTEHIRNLGRRIRALEAHLAKAHESEDRAVQAAEKAEAALWAWESGYHPSTNCERGREEPVVFPHEFKRAAGRDSGESAREAAERSATADDSGRAAKRGTSCGLDTPDSAAAKSAARQEGGT